MREQQFVRTHCLIMGVELTIPLCTAVSTNPESSSRTMSVGASDARMSVDGKQETHVWLGVKQGPILCCVLTVQATQLVVIVTHCKCTPFVCVIRARYV